MGGHNAWITHEQTSIDAMAMAEMREVRVRKTTLRFVRRNAHTRAFPARTRALFHFRSTVRRRDVHV